MTAAERWASSLAEWALPAAIIDAAPESPWGFPVSAFTDYTRAALDGPRTPTNEAVADAVAEGGVLLDVGCGGGAASLPVAPPAGRIVALDEDPRMLEAMAELAADRVEVVPVVGRWPDVAAEVGVVDVTVCANVAYNVSDIGPFLVALTEVTRTRVVLEITATHPQSALSPLWARLWGLDRPTRPVADDAEDVIREATGVAPASRRWVSERQREHLGDPEHVAWLRRRLCLPASREVELREALEDLPVLSFPPEMVTFWWPGSAGRP